MSNIGAKDPLDRALINQYAQIQTCTFDPQEKIKPDEVLDMMARLSSMERSFHLGKAA